MKVICIDSEAWPDGVENQPSDIIKVGNTYEVIDVKLAFGYVWYELAEDIGFVYWERCFAQISDIDETEMERNYNLETVKTLLP